MDKTKIGKLIRDMQNSEDCFGYKEHKVLTTNLIFNYQIEGDKISLAMRRLKEFAEECYRNGWLQATEIISEKINK